VQQRCI
jgi:hypothetical protein